MQIPEKLLLNWFARSWCRESSAFPEAWSPENPACGQCLSTAWITQLLLGGSIQVALVMNRYPHFYNELSTGHCLDLTRSQFSSRRIVMSDGHAQSLENIKAFARWFPAVHARFECLRERFSDVSGLSISSC